MRGYFMKHELLFTMLLIIIYIISNSFCINNFGLTDYRSTLVNVILSISIIIFIIKNKLLDYYNLTKIPKFKDYLYFVPLLLIISVNLWGGININNNTYEIIFYILSMICVGFLEEIIFRGFLFKMMEKDNLNTAIIVTSLTFGIGHIINLFNGSDVFYTLLQVCYSMSIGYLFVMILIKSKSLYPCIITHIMVNSLSIFNDVSNSIFLFIEAIFLIIVPIVYASYINKRIK